jgi:flagellar motor component MotA
LLEIVEPTAPDTMFTSPIDLKKAGYSIQEDYPDTYGFVETVKNWYKINKKQKYAEYVHASGSALKVDKDGNTTIEIKGKLKFIQRGEMTHFIGDNLDIAIDGSFYHHIMGELKQIIDGDNNQDVGGNQTIKVSGNQKVTASRIDLN